MKIFVSWSGNLSQSVALLLRNWIPSVLSFVQPFVSSEDLDKGARWSGDILQQLETTNYGVLCVTRDNFNSPWLVFEAGALMKAVARNRVSPFLFNLTPTDLTGPLTQFQATQRTKEDVRKMVLSINRAAKDGGQIPEDRAERIFEKFWPDLESEFDGIAKEHPEAARAKRESSKQERVLDELVTLARAQHTLLNSPDELLPPEYVRRLLAQRDAYVPLLNHDLCEAAEQLEAAYGGFRQTLRKVRVPKRVKDEVMTSADALRVPLDRILAHTEQSRRSTS